MAKILNRSSPPAQSPEEREKQLISLATDLAEQRLLDGTASSQLICHYLKLGTTREMLEKEKIEYEKALLKAKADAIQDSGYREEALSMLKGALVSYGALQEDEAVAIENTKIF